MEDLDKLKKKKKSDSTLLDWLKFLSLLLFEVVVVYKLMMSNLNFDFSKFDFSALLALLISLFAIGLSVAFYFKATDSSNLFYDNTYKFTKDISEILGRIEAGFGERLRHLDEGYSGLVTKFDNSLKDDNIKETKAEIEAEKKKLKEDIKERNKIVESLIEQTQLEKAQKNKIREQLKEKESEISKKNSEINTLRHRLDCNHESIDSINLSPLILHILRIYVKKNKSAIVNKSTLELLDDLTIDNNFSHSEQKQLFDYGIIGIEGKFTLRGIRALKQIIKQAYIR